MFLGQMVGRGRDPCPLPGSHQDRGQGSVAVPTPGRPGLAPADRSPRGGEAEGGREGPWGFVSAGGLRARPDSGILFAQFSFSGLWNSALGPGGLPLRCPAPAGPSLEAFRGSRVLGVRPYDGVGVGVGQVGGSPRRTVTQDGSARVECRHQAEPFDPQGPQASGTASSHVGGCVGGLALPEGLLVGAWGLGVSVCTALPTAPASDGALRLVPCAQRS